MSNVNRNRNINSLLIGGGTGLSDNNMNWTAQIKLKEVVIPNNALKFKNKPPYHFPKRAFSNKGSNETRTSLQTQEGKRRKFK